MNKAWNKRSEEEKFKKSLVKRSVCYFLCGGVGVEILFLNLHFGLKKHIFNQDHRSSAVQRATVKNCGGRDTAREPQEFLEFVNLSGRGSKTKISSYSTHQWRA